MTEFMCLKLKAKARLRFPLLSIEYEDKWITPKVQEHYVFPVTLYHHKYGWGPEIRGHTMLDIAGFLSTLDPGLVKSKAWDYYWFDLTLEFTKPVSVGEHANIKKIVMTYYPWWAATEAMLAAHVAWRARVGMRC